MSAPSAPALLSTVLSLTASVPGTVSVLGNAAPSGADLYTLGSLALDDSTVGVIGP